MAFTMYSDIEFMSPTRVAWRGKNYNSSPPSLLSNG